MYRETNQSGSQSANRNSSAHKPEPFALVRKQANSLHISALNAAAQQGGVKRGMQLTDACALLPALSTQTWDGEADSLALCKLAEWCQRYTPTVSIDGEDSLWLDITGAAHLLGGEQQLLADLKSRLNAIGFESRLGLAQTPGAAWAVARFSSGKTAADKIIPPGGVEAALAPLQLKSLRLEQNALYLLRRFGFKKIADLYNIPRSSLKRRFQSKDIGDAVMHRLDQALGRATEPLLPLRNVPVYREHISCAEPVLETESFRIGLDDLLDRLCQRMEKARKGATALTYEAFHTDGGISRISIATAAPSRNRAHLMHLFRDRIETINPGFGVDHLVLCADRTETLQNEQLSLSVRTVGTSDHNATNQLIDRLANRLGAQNVQWVIPRESHLPECSEIRVSATQSVRLTEQNAPPKPLRPFRILDRPEPVQVMAEVPEGPPMRFIWRRVSHRVARSQGPERIAPEWWHAPRPANNRTRDYYRVEDTEGRSFWLYREGLFRDGEKLLPTWHMHGLFG